MSTVTSELTIVELEGQVGEFLPAREEMKVAVNRVGILNLGNRSGNTFADGNVQFGGRSSTSVTKFNLPIIDRRSADNRTGDFFDNRTINPPPAA